MDFIQDMALKAPAKQGLFSLESLVFWYVRDFVPQNAQLEE